ncbi:MAG: HBL/NHE enterotoxin family protein [Bacillus sp. (in: firmicutes)]|uniref:HBL/NHE enterotoxin family protein n=1 Tax=Bacillus sp. TaxID=1409 RepID=UPI0039E2BF44
MNKIAYKVITFVVVTAISTVSFAIPSRSLAQEKLHQLPQHYDNTAPSSEMQLTLNKLGDFAASMNAYSLMLLRNPNVDLDELQWMGYRDLLINIRNNQEYARNNALQWERILKPMLIGVNQNIINYDLKFQNYYNILSNAVNKNDKSTLAEGISNLQNSIKYNREQANQLREQLKMFRELVGQDSRAFSDNISVLSAILQAQIEGIPEDQNRVQSLMQQMSHSNQMWYTGMAIVGIPVIGWIAGGIILATSSTKLKRLNPLLQELQGRVDYRITLSRIVGIANGSLQNMLGAVNGAINTLGEMAAHWDSVDAKYTGLLGHINDASHVSIHFILSELNTSKDSWSDLRQQAELLDKTIKGLITENNFR